MSFTLNKTLRFIVYLKITNNYKFCLAIDCWYLYPLINLSTRLRVYFLRAFNANTKFASNFNYSK